MDTFDLRRSIVSFSLLQITNRFKQLKTGEVMEIIGDDPSLVNDLERVLPGLEYEFAEIDNTNESGRDFRLRLIKSNPKKTNGGE
jgi:TusA-related sulfurtransferase